MYHCHIPASRWILILISLFAQLSLSGQQYYFRHYQVDQGLSNNTIYCSLQGDNGFMWFGTKEGLNRFDGYRFRLFSTPKTKERPVNSDYIYSLYKDRKGTIYAGAKSGLYRVDEFSEQLICITDTLRDIFSMVQTPNGEVWFNSGLSLHSYDPASGRIRRILPANDIRTTAITITNDQRIWIGDEYGNIYRFHDADSSFSKFHVFNNTSPEVLKRINKLVPDGNSDIFICTAGQGIKQFTAADSTYTDIITYNADRTPVFARDVLNLDSTNYWMATESGIFIYNRNNKKIINLRKTFQDPYSISDNAVYNLTSDNEGGIWCGTYFGGINYYHQQYSNFQKYYPDLSNASISGSSVREIRTDSYNNLWMATEDAGLNRMNLATGEIKQFKPAGKKGDISYSNIHGLLADGNDLWIGTFEHGLDIMNIRTGNVYRHYDPGPGKNDLTSNFIVTIIKNRAGNIYLGTGSGVFRYRPQTDDFEPIKDMPRNIFVSILYEDHSGRIWVGTHGAGTYYFNPLTGETGNLNSSGLKSNVGEHININDIIEDREKRLWICTEGGGLVRLAANRQTDTIYWSGNGFPSNYIFKALQDRDGTIWISTSRGLVRMDPRDHSITVFTKETGLLNDQFNYSSGTIDPSGRLYFGSIKGMISFLPDDIKENDFTPRIFITGFQVHNKELSIRLSGSPLKQSILHTDKITLPYDQSSFSIDFAALSFTSPEVTTYQYKMEGLDDQWIYLQSNRKVYFTNLSAGKYRFLVNARTSAGNTTDTRELTIQILPPIWATGWAYALYLSLLGLLAAYLFITYHNRIQLRKEKEIYEAKIDFFTNVAHEIKTPLTLIKGPVENLQEKTEELPSIKKDVSMLERNTNRLINLVQQMLDFRQTETRGFHLDFSKVNISNEVTEVFDDFKPSAQKKRLEYKLLLPETVLQTMADEEALQKIFSNLFSNAIKYGNTLVVVELKLPGPGNPSWRLEVSNDGFIIPADMKEKIFEPFFRLSESGRQKGTGIGLTLARSLAELHGGKLYLAEATGDTNKFVLEIPFSQ